MSPKKRKAKIPVDGVEGQTKKTKTEESTSSSVTGADPDSSFFTGLDGSLGSVFESADSATTMDGGELPDTVNVLKFVESRVNEIASTMSSVKSTKKSQCLQQLPRHMRRRAASHNANRVPRRLKGKVANEIQKAKKGKQPSRKHRRRPSNLLLEYNRRQKTFVWLETHIWFAKRFKMQNLWGYKLPLHPNDKSVRAAYKASSQYVLLQDMSYMCCIELKATQNLLLDKLAALTKASVGLTFGAKLYLSGSREGHVILYHPDSYPFKCIGPVSFLWKPFLIPQGDVSILDEAAGDDSTTERQLWIWCHPICHQELASVLQNLLQLEIEELEDANLLDLNLEQSDPPDGEEPSCSGSSEQYPGAKIKQEKLSVSSIDQSQISGGNKSQVLDAKVKFRLKRLESYSSAEVKMTLLKDSLVRHRLVGPLSQSVIVDALKCADVSSGGGGKALNVTKGAKWWEEFYRKSGNRSLHTKQKELLEQMASVQSPTLLPPGMVLGLTVKDPRLDLPKEKIKVSSQYEDRWKGTPCVFSNQLPHSLSFSPLWDESIRTEVSSEKVPEQKLNEMRSKFLVPGSRLELGREESRVPLIIIQCPGHGGYGTGWDIIAPMGFSMAFWVSFIYRGARASGLRETKSMNREAGVPHFPDDFPDTLSGIESDEVRRLELMTKHYRYPPDKRPSFGKLGILSPYFRPWEMLVSEWELELKPVNNGNAAQNLLSTPDSRTIPEMQFPLKECETGRNFLVLRDKKKLAVLKEACTSLGAQCQRRNPQTAKQHAATWNALEEFVAFVRCHNTSLRRSILCVQLKCLNKGRPCDFSGIYLPTNIDLRTLKSNSNYGGPVEHVHPVQKVPKEGIKQKTPKPSTSVKEQATDDSARDTISDKLLRPQLDSLISHCDRKLIGFVDVGEFSLVTGCGCGIGHCSLVGFLDMLSLCSTAKTLPTVLIRSQSSFQYRFASISVITKIW